MKTTSGSNGLILIVNDRYSNPPYRKLAKDFNFTITGDQTCLINSPEKVHLVVFTGGEDVSPSLYQEERIERTRSSFQRDTQELNIFNAAKKYNIPFAGICRGAQFLCVMAGGKLVQDLNGHHANHYLQVSLPGRNAFEVFVTSSHHQAQYPFNLPPEEFQVIGEMKEPLSFHYDLNPTEKYYRLSTGHKHKEITKNLIREVDIVWYPRINALATQYHPEWMSNTSPGFQLYEELLKRYIYPSIEKRLARKQTTSTQAS